MESLPPEVEDLPVCLQNVFRNLHVCLRHVFTILPVCLQAVLPTELAPEGRPADRLPRGPQCVDDVDVAEADDDVGDEEETDEDDRPAGASDDGAGVGVGVPAHGQEVGEQGGGGQGQVGQQPHRGHHGQARLAFKPAKIQEVTFSLLFEENLNRTIRTKESPNASSLLSRYTVVQPAFPL